MIVRMRDPLVVELITTQFTVFLRVLGLDG